MVGLRPGTGCWAGAFYFSATWLRHRGFGVQEGDIESVLNGEFDLEITNFIKYNPGKTPYWFRLQADWFLDPKFHEMPESTQLLFIKLCSIRAASGGRLVGVTSAWVQRRVGVRSSSCKRGLITLWKKGLIFLQNIQNRTYRTDEEGAAPPAAAKAEVSVVEQAEKILTPEGVYIYRARFGDEYAAQLENCFMHWKHSRGPTADSKEFVTVLSRWWERWKNKEPPGDPRGPTTKEAILAAIRG